MKKYRTNLGDSWAEDIVIEKPTAIFRTCGDCGRVKRVDGTTDTPEAIYTTPPPSAPDPVVRGLRAAGFIPDYPVQPCRQCGGHEFTYRADYHPAFRRVRQ